MVAQWALLLALGTLVVIMYRHLGRAMAKRAPAEFGPPVGSRAASFEYISRSGERRQLSWPGQGRATLVAFVEPSCLSCEQLVATMGTALDSGELTGLRTLLVTSEPQRRADLSAAFRGTRLEIGRLVARATSDDYNVSATPLLVGIDDEGVVRSAGPARDVTELRAAIQACLPPAPQVSLPVATSHAHHGPYGAATGAGDAAMLTDESQRERRGGDLSS